MSNNSQKKISRLVIVQARTGSTRLPNKILQDLGGKNLLTVFMERVTKAVEPDNIVIATTNLPEDDDETLSAAEMVRRTIRQDDGVISFRVRGGKGAKPAKVNADDFSEVVELLRSTVDAVEGASSSLQK